MTARDLIVTQDARSKLSIADQRTVEKAQMTDVQKVREFLAVMAPTDDLPTPKQVELVLMALRDDALRDVAGRIVCPPATTAEEPPVLVHAPGCPWVTYDEPCECGAAERLEARLNGDRDA